MLEAFLRIILRIMDKLCTTFNLEEQGKFLPAYH